MNSPILTILSFLIIFTVVVVSHEFGHYLLARLNGIRVREFSVGMGPAIFRKKGKMTELVIRALPIGGACIFEGEPGEGAELGQVENKDADEEARDEIRDDLAGKAFNDAPVWGRIASVVAGPFFNIILAFLLGLVMVWFSAEDLPIVHTVMEGYPAQESGMQPGDRIVSIDGYKVNLYREAMIKSYMNNGKPMEITYERDGVQTTVTINPKYDETAGRYYIGFAGPGDYKECNNLSVFRYSAYEVRYMLMATWDSLLYMLSGHASVDNLAGPVGVANVIDETIEETAPQGAMMVIINLLNIAILLSVNLGVLNLLPVPALDGGRLLFLLFEAISGRRVPPEKEGFVHLIGFVLLMLLMIVVLFNDISRFFR